MWGCGGVLYSLACAVVADPDANQPLHGRNGEEGSIPRRITRTHLILLMWWISRLLLENLAQEWIYKHASTPL
jgi:hypothetical protein